MDDVIIDTVQRADLTFAPVVPSPPADLTPVEEPIPPWLQYEPPIEQGSGYLLISAKKEFDDNLRPRDLADRLRRNGVGEKALETLVLAMQDRGSGWKTRIAASEILMKYAYGTPVSGNDRGNTVQVLVQIDR